MADTVSVARTKRILAGLLVAIAVIAGLAVLRAYSPQDYSFYPKCTLYQWTGLHCPGCGGTRAMGSLVRGDLWMAIRFNPLIILGGPFILGVLWILRRRERAGSIGSPRAIWTLFFVVVGFAVARNIPSPTRSWLAPPASESNDPSKVNETSES